jgi:hypothetical protein
MEGIAMGVDPNFKVLSAAYPYVAKRLLTDPAPALRTSLRELLFKDGSFRWNRLENLLRNARDNRDYDLNHALNQGADFLFSERGEFIRDRITEEVIKALDGLGQTAINSTIGQVSESVQRWIGARSTALARVQPAKTQSSSATHYSPADVSVKAAPNPSNDSNSFEQLQRIFSILEETPGFEPMQLLPILMKLLVRTETQQMGQKIAYGLIQRNLARLIRDLLITDAPTASNWGNSANRASLPVIHGVATR